MYIFVVLKTNKGNYELEKFDFTEWENMKSTFDRNSVIYESVDIEDRGIKKYGFKNITWGRIKNSDGKTESKVVVPISKNFEWMEMKYNESVAELKAAEKKFAQKVNDNNPDLDFKE